MTHQFPVQVYAAVHVILRGGRKTGVYALGGHCRHKSLLTLFEYAFYFYSVCHYTGIVCTQNYSKICSKS